MFLLSELWWVFHKVRVMGVRRAHLSASDSWVSPCDCYWHLQQSRLPMWRACHSNCPLSLAVVMICLVVPLALLYATRAAADNTSLLSCSLDRIPYYLYFNSFVVVQFHDIESSIIRQYLNSSGMSILHAICIWTTEFNSNRMISYYLQVLESKWKVEIPCY